MPSYWKHVNQVLRDAEIIIEVLDARMVEQTRHIEIEQKVQRQGKILLYVFNKCDLVDPETLARHKKSLHPSVFISSREKLGTTILKKKILELSHGERVTVGILGYPNVGKSSLINALAGRSATLTSSESGFTRGVQKVRVDPKIMVIDTPGVFPQEENDQQKYGTTGAVSHGKVKDPEGVVLALITEEKKAICKYYKITAEDPEEILEKIALHLHKLLKGNLPDTETAARLVLKDWQTGKIHKNL